MKHSSLFLNCIYISYFYCPYNNFSRDMYNVKKLCNKILDLYLLILTTQFILIKCLSINVTKSNQFIINSRFIILSRKLIICIFTHCFFFFKNIVYLCPIIIIKLDESFKFTEILSRKSVKFIQTINDIFYIKYSTITWSFFKIKDILS